MKNVTALLITICLLLHIPVLFSEPNPIWIEAFDDSTLLENDAGNYYHLNINKLEGEIALQIRQLRLVQSSDIISELEDRILNEVMSSQERIRSLLNEIKIINSAGEFKGKKLTRPFSVISTSSLRGYWHELLGVASLEMSPKLQTLQNSLLADLESELQRRQVLPSRIGSSSINLLQQRYVLVERFNQEAIFEAEHLINRSPYVMESQAKMGQLLVEIRNIDQQMTITNLPSARDLLTESTISKRLDLLQFGKEKLEVENLLKRQYDVVAQNHLFLIEEYLNNEKKWIQQKRLEAIIRSNSYRGPPRDTPDPIFKLPPDVLKPLQDSNNPVTALTMDEFLDQTYLNDIRDFNQKSYSRLVSQQKELFSAYFLEDPNWAKINNRIIPDGRPREFNYGSNDYLKSLTLDYYESLLTDPSKTALNLGELDVWQFRVGIGHDKSKFLGDDLVLIDDVLKNLEKGFEIRNTQQTAMGLQTPFYLKEEIALLEKEISSLTIYRDLVRESLAKGVYPPRPPPFNYNITEKFHRELLNAQVKQLEIANATYGIHSPPGIDSRIRQINETLQINDAARSISQFKELNNYRSIVQLFDNIFSGSASLSEEKLAEYLIHFNLDDYRSLLTNRELLYNRISTARENLGSLEVKGRLSGKFISQLEQAKSALPKPKVITAEISGIDAWRPSQELRRFDEMSGLKDPGGIWLTPDGQPIQVCELSKDNWRIIDNELECAFDGERAWKIDDDYTVCFPINKTIENTDHWLKDVKTW